MTPRYPLYHRQSARPSHSPDQASSRWWRPLTNGWGIFGVIVFIGLVMRLIDRFGHWRARQPLSLTNEQATDGPHRTSGSIVRAITAHRRVPGIAMNATASTAAGALPMVSQIVGAQTYPARPVRLVVGYADGGGPTSPRA
jgi:hypothetical protein